MMKRSKKIMISEAMLTLILSCSITKHESFNMNDSTTILGEDIEKRNQLRHKGRQAGRKYRRQLRHNGRKSGQEENHILTLTL